MRSILTIVRHNLKMFFRTPLSLLLFMAPILTTILLTSMLQGNSFKPDYAVSVVGEREIQGLEEVIGELGKNIEIFYEDTAIAEEKLNKKERDMIIYIETNNLIKMIKTNKKDIKIVFNQDSIKKDYVLQKFEEALSNIGILIQISSDDNHFKEVYKIYSNHKVKMEADEASKDLYINIQTFAIFVMIFLFTCIKSLNVMMYEKDTKVYERIFTTPCKKYEYIGGHLIGAFVVLLGQILIQTAIMRGMGITFGMESVTFIGICILLGVVGIALSLLLLATTRNSDTYALVASFSVTGICMVSDCIFPAQFLPEAINKVTFISPVRWIMITYKSVLQHGEIQEVIGSSLIALGISVIFILAAIFIEQSKNIV